MTSLLITEICAKQIPESYTTMVQLPGALFGTKKLCHRKQPKPFSVTEHFSRHARFSVSHQPSRVKHKSKTPMAPKILKLF